ncbi:hypothetical protein C8J57DRAFT_1213306 [Mycena rebaudengoi]|nr:hypothetical protein C8J57DRAFT_1213306 [Mycena rebaudengoi]
MLWNGHDTDAEVASAWPGVGTVGVGVEQPGSVPRPVDLDVTTKSLFQLGGEIFGGLVGQGIKIALLFWEQAATQYSPVPSIPGFSKLLDRMILHLGSTTEWQIIAIQCSPVYGTLRFFKVDS